MSEETKAVTPKVEKKIEITEGFLEKLLASQDERTEKIIQKLREPSEAEKKKLAKEAKQLLDDNQSRLEQAKLVREKNDNEAAFKLVCSHKHATGQSHGVYIQDGNYIHCQACHANIRPEPAPAGFKPNGRDFYNTAVFNRVWQELPTGATFG